MMANKPLPNREALVRRIELNSARADLSPLGELLVAIARAAHASICRDAQAARQWRAIS